MKSRACQASARLEIQRSHSVAATSAVVSESLMHTDSTSMRHLVTTLILAPWMTTSVPVTTPRFRSRTPTVLTTASTTSIQTALLVTSVVASVDRKPATLSSLAALCLVLHYTAF